MHLKLYQSFLIILILILPTQLLALESDKKEPLHIKADHVFFDHKNGINTYEGHVVLTQGSTELVAETILVHFDKEDQLEKIIAKGEPARYRTLFAIDKPEIIGTASVMEYYPIKNLLRLSEHARIAEGPNSYEGSQIEYHITNRTVTSAIAENGMIHIRLQPQRKYE